MTSEPPSTRLPLAWRSAGLAALLAAAMALPLFRQGDAPLYETIWAEDGSIFLTDALADSLPETAARSYAGYMHLVPRAVGALAAAVPLDLAAAAIAVGATLVVALLAWFTYVASDALLAPRWQRALLAGLVVLPPLAGETVGNISNLHWYLTAAAFWALVAPPASTGRAAAAAAVAGAAAMSNPLAGAYLPLAAWVAWRHRTRRYGAVLGAYLAGLAVQAIVVLTAEAPPAASASRLADVATIFAVRVAGGLAVGERYLGRAWDRAGWLLAGAALAALAAVVGWGVVRSRGDRRLRAAAATLYGVGLFAATLWIRGTEGIRPQGGEPLTLDGSRYTLIPAVLLLAVALVPFGDLPPGRARTVLIGALAVWAAVVVAANFVIDPRMPPGPPWPAQVDRVEAACATGLVADVPAVIAPESPPFGSFFAVVPCGDRAGDPADLITAALDADPQGSFLIDRLDDAEVLATDDDCATIAAGEQPAIDVEVDPAGATIVAAGDRPGTLRVALPRAGSFAGGPVTEFPLDGRQAIEVAATGALPVPLRLEPPPGAELTLCAGFRDRLPVSAAAGPPARARLADTGDVDILAQRDGCLEVAAGTLDPRVILAVDHPGAVTVTSDRAGDLVVFTAWRGPFRDDATLRLPMADGEPTAVTVELRDGPLLVRFDPPTGATTSICATIE